MSCRGRPVEAAGDHCFVVDHCELVVDISEMGPSDCVLRRAQALKARVQAGLTDWTG